MDVSFTHAIFLQCLHQLVWLYDGVKQVPVHLAIAAPVLFVQPRLHCMNHALVFVELILHTPLYPKASIIAFALPLQTERI